MNGWSRPEVDITFKISACFHLGGMPEMGSEVIVWSAPVQSQKIFADPEREGCDLWMLCKSRWIARRPIGSPLKALAEVDTSVVEKDSLFWLSPEQTSGCSSLMYKPSDTHTRVPFLSIDISMNRSLCTLNLPTSVCETTKIRLPGNDYWSVGLAAGVCGRSQ